MGAPEETIFTFNLNEQCEGERYHHGANSPREADATASIISDVAWFLMTAAHRRGMLSTKLFKTLRGIPVHSSLICSYS